MVEMTSSAPSAMQTHDLAGALSRVRSACVPHAQNETVVSANSAMAYQGTVGRTW